MMRLPEKTERLLKNCSIRLSGEITERYGENEKYDIEPETYSPEGEDVIVPLVYDGTEEDLIRAFTEYADNFDAEEHAGMWIESRGKNGAPKSIKDLLEDAGWIKNKLAEAAEALNSPEPECMAFQIQ